ncbi:MULTISPECIES: hypothetical protein [unclassified Neptuniibacter]|uniref:hypothetical protein n=1 Tax=unclassified Neptuniibacter TaxID=2630693 RepID=UPI000C63A0C6|nr:MULTISPECIES: hypothetical protein [unclassified Neptuniibacter]MAY42573.1 hypothetical protein [Oceanospirillaceae bacterium]|tara:strand:+ start:27206 stop:28366 length:1161 start_codon:yes stop_codon:yes gene_type:complete
MVVEAHASSLTHIAGRLNIIVKYDGQKILAVLINSTRPKLLTRLLEGKRPEEAFNLIPLIFSLCGTAQTVAGAMAIESLRGVKVCKEVEIARSVLIYLETAKELCLRLSKDWLENAPLIDVYDVMTCYRSALSQLGFSLDLQTDTSNAQAEFNYAELLYSLEKLLLPLTSFCEKSTSVERGITPFSQLVDNLNAQFEGVELGPSAPALNLTAEYLEQKFESDDVAAVFCSRPTIETNGGSMCAETGVWARHADNKLILQAEAEGSHQLTLRFLALVYELASIPAKIREIINSETGRLGVTASEGLATVNTARGLLVHKVTLENVNGDERINKYHIIAPTEWNFHPEGSLISILQGVVVSRENLMPLLDKLILAIDPCVAYDIKIEE